MKTKLILGIVAGLLCSCREEETNIRKEAIAEIAQNMGKAEAERFIAMNLESARRRADGCRRAVESASTAQEIALAVEDLRQANDDVTRVERELKELD